MGSLRSLLAPQPCPPSVGDLSILVASWTVPHGGHRCQDASQRCCAWSRTQGLSRRRQWGVGDRHFCDLITGSKNPGRMNYVPFMGCLFLLVLKMDGFMK